ncbi:MAG: alpha-amylase family glycosyl hydrolase, partial [Rikenellaceae bacterium]
MVEYIYNNDNLLTKYKPIIKHRAELAVIRELEFTNRKKKLADCFNSYLYYGLHKQPEGWVFRELAPNATAVWLIGEFSDWEVMNRFRLERKTNGVWEIELPTECLHHGMCYKLYITWEGGSGERLPSHARRVIQNEDTKQFTAQVWNPRAYQWRSGTLQRADNPLIYEAHIGMCTEHKRVSTFTEFRLYVLPRIIDLGYNTIQLMGIQEHPYYGSFGYQVSNFFAVSSRFGTPEELKELIDEAHSHGIHIIMDLVHSHSVKNEVEGLSCFDGTDYLYFHSGARGKHKLWDSRCFNYGKNEVLNFLLSNCKYWLEEFRFDGFRFDGVTSMIYLDHGDGRCFTNYSDYYDNREDEDAITYLTLANKVIHEVNPSAVTIAEDVSGMPGLAYPIEGGGMGFDFRLNMGIADYWIKLIKEQPDEKWHVGDLFFQLTNKRKEEHTINYAESHD